ncbi:MAG: glycosyltransferase family 4 protein [Chloroflexi bacterium]|nr:glycosyltransferase family 4 protein [Chloroflexota bacterium]
MNILTVIHEFPPIGGGGGQIARDLAIALAKRGHQLRVVSAAFEDLPEREMQDGIEIVRLKSYRTQAYRAGFPTMAAFILAANRYCLRMRDFTPDIVHAHFAVPGGPAVFPYAQWRKIPYVLTVHLGDIPGASPEKTGKWFRFVYPFTHSIWEKASRVVAVSEFSRSLALKSYQVPIDVIPNGIDYDAIHNRTLEPHSPLKIAFAGRFVPQKNLPVLVEALAEVKELDWRCQLLGDGQDRPQIEALIHQKELQNKISITGWVKPQQVVEAFHQSDLLFLPSLTEGLPIVGIQAMASGLALLLSDAGGNREIVVENKNGYARSPHDVQGYAALLRELINDPELVMTLRRNSLEMAKQYDIALIAAQYEAVFNEVLNSRKKS